MAQERLPYSLANLLQGDRQSAQQCAQMARTIKHVEILANDCFCRTQSHRLHGEQVGWRNFPPMSSIPPGVLRDLTKNIIFGTSLTHIDEGNRNCETEALQAQCPIVCFKASTVLHGMEAIASRTLLPSTDKEGERRQRTYCPTTFNYADSYDTPGAYSDQLAQHGSTCSPTEGILRERAC